MASSTSSSRASAQPWHRTLGWALACVVLTLGAWELTWRAQGYRPSAKDNIDRWSRAAKKAVDSGEHAIALIGSSRIMQAVDLQTLREQLPGRIPVQLGMSGAPALPVLEFLAEHTAFNGTAVVEITPYLMFRPHEMSARWIQSRIGQMQREELLSEPSYFDFERRIATWLQERLLVATWTITPTGLLRNWARGRWPMRPFWWISSERQQFMDYSNVDVESFAQSRVAGVVGAGAFQPQQLRASIPRIQAWANAIRARGGDVVFLRTPTQGELLTEEQQRFPREQVWDILLQQTDIPGIHFAELLGMHSFSCTDLEHLDVESSPLFTRLLVEEVVDSGLVVDR